MSESTKNRGPRRVLLATAAALVLGAGGAGVAYASSNDAGPVETGYVVVGTSDGGAQDAADNPGTSPGTDRECDEQRGGGGGGQSPSPSTPAPSSPATPDAEGQL